MHTRHKSKKDRKHKHKDGKSKTHRQAKPVIESDDEEEEQKPAAAKHSRNRRVVVDSDDEEEEGEWLVPEDQQHAEDLGKAGFVKSPMPGTVVKVFCKPG